jgi:hypothetical protein
MSFRGAAEESHNCNILRSFANAQDDNELVCQ